MKKAKFRGGQVVMVVQARADGMARYPVKLDHQTRIGTRDGVAWMDTLSNVEYESMMRPLTDREIGPRPAKRGRKQGR